MKTILAFSDIHHLPLPARIREIAGEVDYVFFLGDGNFGALKELMLLKNFYAVGGNCDPQGLPLETVLEIDGVRTLITHGHKYRVKDDRLSLLYRSKELKCSAVFYGHTHIPSIEVQEGVTLICPGAICSPLFGTPTYSFTVFSNGKILNKTVKL